VKISHPIPKFLFPLFIGTVIFFSACEKEDVEPVKDCPPTQPPPVTTDPTPYFLQVPFIFQRLLPPPVLPEDNPLTVEGVNLGKRLFFEKKLSRNNQLSCAGCHRPEVSFNDEGLALSRGVSGQLGVRNAMPLFNLVYTMNNGGSGFNWHGSVTSLEEQAFEPVRNPLEMEESWPDVMAKLQADPLYPPLFRAAFGTDIIDSQLVVKAIAQFERTLISGNSRMDRYVKNQLFEAIPNDDILTAQEKRGLTIYQSEKGDCTHCHGNSNLENPLWTNNDFSNNGLDLQPDSGRALVTGKSADIGKFKIPSLRNLVFTAPYMHDGRFNTLEEVVDFYSDSVQANSPNIDPLMKDRGSFNAKLNPQEKADLVAFLKTLTDSSFVNNPDFRP
jgi:cytochrome c peroxidase